EVRAARQGLRAPGTLDFYAQGQDNCRGCDGGSPDRIDRPRDGGRQIDRSVEIGGKTLIRNSFASDRYGASICRQSPVLLRGRAMLRPIFALFACALSVSTLRAQPTSAPPAKPAAPATLEQRIAALEQQA